MFISCRYDNSAAETKPIKPSCKFVQLVQMIHIIKNEKNLFIIQAILNDRGSPLFIPNLSNLFLQDREKKLSL